jgi:hypothetical protein
MYDRLATEDLLSATWARIQTALMRRLESLRIQNDADISEKETADLRGRIGEVKALLAAGKAPPADEMPDPDG